MKDIRKAQIERVKHQELKAVEEYAIENGLTTKSRQRELVYSRYYLMHYLVNIVGCTKTATGLIFNRDHATVLHGIGEFKKFENDAFFLGTAAPAIAAFPPSRFNMPNFKNYRLERIHLSTDNIEKLKRLQYFSDLSSIDEACNQALDQYFNILDKQIRDELHSGKD